MVKSDTFEKYRKRLVKEGIVKSLLLGLALGLFALAVVAFFTWLFGYKPGLFVALASFVFVAAATVPVFYFLKFRPTVKQIARRMDALGLEERVLTMTELEGDDSYIARIQREDAEKTAKKLNAALLKLAVSAAIVVPFAVACVFGLGMTTVSALHYAGIIPSGIVTIEHMHIPGEYTVSYTVEEGCEGTIIYYTGDWSAETPVTGSETVKEGETAKAVYAVPAEDWAFVSWSDGLRDPYRQDTVLDGDIIVQAIFEAMEPDPEDGEEQNSDSQDGEGEGESDEPQEGEPQEGDGENQGEGDPEEQEEQKPSGEPNDQMSAGGMRDVTSQQIVDGDTYYGDEFDDAYRQAMDRLENDKNIPDELKQHISDYYDSLETSGKTGKGNNQNSGNDEDEGQD